MAKLTQWPSLSHFEWGVAKNGYETFVDRVHPNDSEIETYNPADLYPGLHREFLSLNGTTGDGATICEDGEVIPGHTDGPMKRFIHTYGLLGLAGEYPPKEETLTELWQVQGRMCLYQAFVHDDPMMPAEERNKIFNRFCPAHFKPVLEQEDGRTVLKIAVTSLLAWMWVRLAQEKTGELELRRCRWPKCTKQWFTVGPHANQMKNSAKYCSDTCRVAHWRQMNAQRQAPVEVQRMNPRKGGSK